MGVASTTNRLAYAGNGSTTSFSFPYYVFATTDLLVFVYDTITGAVTQKNLGADFTVTGTANYQGLYPSGVNVVMGVAPSTTEYLVVARNPPQVQNFSILENGIISSTALVQQMDYLTLLIQRLEDQVSRAMVIPDGMAASFSQSLPSNVALSPLAYPQVNAAGNGWQLSNTGAGWGSIVIPYSTLQAAALTNTAVALTLPAAGILKRVVIKHTQAFAGTAISSLIAQVGTAGTPGFFIGSFDLLQAVSDSAFDGGAPNYIGSWANTTQILLKATAVGANLSALTQGSVTVYYQYDIV